MAKKGMKRIDRTHTAEKNDVPPVPEIQGKAKHSNKKANPIIAGTQPPGLKVYHTVPMKNKSSSNLDNDLARDNLENDLSKADRQDLY